MPVYKGNDMDFFSEVLTDANGDAITGGVVNVTILDETGTTVLIALAAMSHVAAGVWKKTHLVALIDDLVDGHERVLIRITVGASPINATFERLEDLVDRRSP